MRANVMARIGVSDAWFVVTFGLLVLVRIRVMVFGTLKGTWSFVTLAMMYLPPCSAAQ